MQISRCLTLAQNMETYVPPNVRRSQQKSAMGRNSQILHTCVFTYTSTIYNSLTHNLETASCLLAEVFQYNSFSASKTSSTCYHEVQHRQT